MRANISEGKLITAKETDLNFAYIPYRRYVVEIKDEDTGRVFHTKRVWSKFQAIGITWIYNSLKGLVAKVFDTKTGEII